MRGIGLYQMATATAYMLQTVYHFEYPYYRYLLAPEAFATSNMLQSV